MLVHTRYVCRPSVSLRLHMLEEFSDSESSQLDVFRAIRLP